MSFERFLGGVLAMMIVGLLFLGVVGAVAVGNEVKKTNHYIEMDRQAAERERQRDLADLHSPCNR